MNLYGLIGYPLGHSFSKKYFTQKFETEDLKDCFFELFPLTSIDELPGLIQSKPSLKGLAITIPYKQSANLSCHKKKTAPTFRKRKEGIIVWVGLL